MARVTVEDCISVVKNRFELSVLAGHRAKEISKGALVTILKQDNDKNTVTSLREIASKAVLVDDLRNHYVRSLQKNAQADDILEEETQNIATDLEQNSAVEVSQDEKEPSEEKTEETTSEEYISVDDYTFEDENDTGD
jgi:DNA-directed RNA polymerase subunit omega